MTNRPFSLLLLLLLLPFLVVGATTGKLSPLGISYYPSPNVPSHHRVAAAVISHGISSVRIVEPNPEIISAFSNTKVPILLSVPNSLITVFSGSRSYTLMWLSNNVVAHIPGANIYAISVGNDALAYNVSADHLLKAIHNVDLSLRVLGIHNISLSTSLDFAHIVSTAYPPSEAEFVEPLSEILVKPLLKFLEDTNSTFFINLHPYSVYRLLPAFPISYALFQVKEQQFHRPTPGLRYHNLFDMMIDALVSAMTVLGHPNIPIVVIETGWPSSGGLYETDANAVYAEMYLKGLLKHLKSGSGTPLRKDAVSTAFIFEMLDVNHTGKGTAGRSIKAEQHWGIFHSNLTMKYNIYFESNSTMKILLCAVMVIAIFVLCFSGYWYYLSPSQANVQAMHQEHDRSQLDAMLQEHEQEAVVQANVPPVVQANDQGDVQENQPPTWYEDFVTIGMFF